MSPWHFLHNPRVSLFLFCEINRGVIALYVVKFEATGRIRRFIFYLLSLSFSHVVVAPLFLKINQLEVSASSCLRRLRRVFISRYLMLKCCCYGNTLDIVVNN